MWMQTLPSIAQANILGFLEIEHALFRVKDLKILAQDLLAGGQRDFWVARAVQSLLNKVGCSKEINQAEEPARQYALPSWLLNYRNQPPVLPWMPITLPLQTNKAKLTSKERVSSCPGNSRQSEELDVSSLDASRNESTCHTSEAIQQEEEDTATGLRTPPPPNLKGCKGTSKKQRSSKAVPSAQDEKKKSMISIKSMEGVQEEPKHSEEDATSVSTLANSLREAWLERQPTIDDLQKLDTLLDASMFFKILKPWEMTDNTIFDMIKALTGKDSGFVWWAQIASYCLLPKLILLEQPASRFLVSAVIEACKAHPRAVIDAVLIPLFLSGEGPSKALPRSFQGPSKAQCDVLNRVLKECLSDNHIFSFCGKIFVSNRRQCLPIPDPPFVRENFLSVSAIWSEPAWTVLQNAISRPIELDIEVLEVLVNICEEEVVKFAKSLQFCNLLLCVLAKYGPRLKPFQSKLQRISEQTQTFMTKALMAKSSGL
ncbi:hypothetical protein GOP47_0028885 [Adiantum capillus-veneris]|nr:hypothetical protein GOP47_0028885 [Adiantum capillus-veneris]